MKSSPTDHDSADRTVGNPRALPRPSRAGKPRLGWVALLAVGAWLGAGNPTAVLAQAKQEPSATSPEEKRQQALREKEARGSYDLILREREAALIRYNYMLPGLRTERKRKAAYEKHFPKPILWAPRFFEVHERYPGTEAAGLALVWIVTHLDSNPLEIEARRILLGQHIAMPELAAVCSALGSAPRAGGEADLVWLFEKSPIPEVQAGALIQLCKLDLQSWQAEQATPVKERLEHRLAMLEVRFSNLRFEGRTGRDWAKQLFREMAHLTLGQQFLDWQAKTLAGEGRQLAALQGKVVVLFFWKSNSNHSRKVVPQVKAFWNAWKAAPVACVGVSGDANAERADRWATILNLPFEQWHAPPSSKEPHPFGVETWPSFFVLNAQGRILASRTDWETARKVADLEIQRLIQAQREAEEKERAAEEPEGPEEDEQGAEEAADEESEKQDTASKPWLRSMPLGPLRSRVTRIQSMRPSLFESDWAKTFGVNSGAFHSAGPGVSRALAPFLPTQALGSHAR